MKYIHTELRDLEKSNTSSTDFDIIDHYEKVTDEESAQKSRFIAKSEGMFVGYTSGACLQAIEQLDSKNF